MSELLLKKVLSKLGVLCLEYHSDGYFSCVGEPPEWSIELFPCIRNRFPRILPLDISAFLDDFMVDAVEFWQSNSSSILRSGYWTESNSGFGLNGRDNHTSQEINLEALVLSVNNQCLLLLEVSAVKFDETLKWLQLARRERLDSLVERKANASQMTSLSLFDSLTGTSNDQAFTIQLAQWLEQLRRGFISTFVLLKLNIDRFRHLNFSLGLVRGDQCLIQVAQRLKHYLGDQDVIARLGADEFAVLVRIPSGLSQDAWMERLMADLRSPYRLGHQQVYISISAGLLNVNDPGWDVEQCLLNVSLALSQAKELGRGHCAVFNAQLRMSSFESVRQEQQLLGALASRTLQVRFRPIFSAQSRQVVGVEPVLDWPLDVSGIVHACELERVAQAANLVVQLSQYAIESCTALLNERDARLLESSLIFGFRVPFNALLDPLFRDAVLAFKQRLNPEDQVILKLMEWRHQPLAVGLEKALEFARASNLKLGVMLSAMPSMDELQQLEVDGVSVFAIALNSLSFPLRLEDGVPWIVQPGHKHIIWGENIDDAAIYQQVVSTQNLDLYAGNHLAEPLPLNAFIQLLQSV